jgi:1-phosphatidylinositol-4-phosphate 5-kinase
MHHTFDLKGTTESRFVQKGEVLKDLNFIDRSVIVPASTADRLVRQIELDSEFLKIHDIMDYSFLLGVVSPAKFEAAEVHANLSSAAAELPESGGQPAERAKKTFLQTIDTKMKTLTGKLRKVLVRGADGEAHEQQLSPSHFKHCLDGVPGLDHDDKPCIYYFGIIDILTKYNWEKKAAHFFKKCTIGCCHEIDTEPPVYYQPRFLKYLREKVIAAPARTITQSVQEASAVKIQRFLRKKRTK